MEEIAPRLWPAFALSFSDRHRGWLTRVVRRTPAGREQQLWDGAALDRIEILTEDDPARLLCVAHGAGAIVSLTSDAPRRVLALRTDDGGDLGLRVYTADGGTTELRFRVAAVPETVDGLPMG